MAETRAQDTDGGSSSSGTAPTCTHSMPELLCSFKDLAQRDARLAPFLNDSGKVNFSLPEPCKAIAQAQMMVELGLPQWQIPSKLHLVPTIPSRYAYVRFIHDKLLPLHQHPTKLVGLDIGTGATCVYPLLGVQSCPRLSFLATDIDESAVSFAEENVQRCGATSRIRVRLVEESQPLFSLRSEDQDWILESSGASRSMFAFTMCNPPFYGALDEAGRHPKRARTGGVNQYVTPGGEVEFISRMIRESAQADCRSTARWFTTLVGRKVDLKTLTGLLRSPEIDARVVRSETLSLGRTARWVLVWSFAPDDGGGAGYSPVEIMSASDNRASIAISLRDCGGAVVDDETIIDLVDAAIPQIPGLVATRQQTPIPKLCVTDTTLSASSLEILVARKPHASDVRLECKSLAFSPASCPLHLPAFTKQLVENLLLLLQN